MLDGWGENQQARARLAGRVDTLVTGSRRHYQAVVTHNEVNDAHGTGIIIQRLAGSDHDVLSIRALSTMGGQQTWGARRLVMPDGLDRAAIYRWTLQATADVDIDRVICVPFSAPELIASVALRDALGVPFCLYIMDDANVAVGTIPDAVMEEAIDKATVRLAISSDMRDMYQAKFARRFWLAPPTTSPGLDSNGSTAAETGMGVIVGNIWGRSWLDALRSTLRTSGLRVDWFANSPRGGWLDLEDDAGLAADGIRLRAPIPEEELACGLSDYDVAVLPTMPSGERENAGVASLSLPSRVPFLVGASDLPMIVLGDPDTCVARFVEHYSIGCVCDYDAGELRQALSTVRDPRWRAAQVQSGRELRSILDGRDISAWFRATVSQGRPPARRFERLVVEPRRVVPQHIGDVPQLGPWMHAFDPVHTGFRRLAASRYRPDFVIDVGASTGVWTHAVSRVFPTTRYVLIEPLLDRHDPAAVRHHLHDIEQVTLCKVAVGDAEATAELHVPASLYQASLYEASNLRDDGAELVTVPVRRLDSLADELELVGRGVLKLDIQGGELAALRGAARLLAEQIDVVVVEVTLDPGHEDVPDYAEVDQHLRGADFIWLDDFGEWRAPDSGWLVQRDSVYVRRDGPLAVMRRGG